MSPSSFMTRVTNVFTAPGELFAEVAARPAQKTSWLLPLLLAIVVSLLSSYVTDTNPSFKQQMREAQSKVYDKMVEKGWMTQEHREEREIKEESQETSIIRLVLTSAVKSPLELVIGAFVLFIVGRVMLSASLGFGKYLELYGLAMVIGVVDSILKLVLMHLLDSIYANPGGGLLFYPTLDPSRFSHRLFGNLSVIGVWHIAILGIGLSKFSGKSPTVTISIVFAIWLVIVLSLVALAGLVM
jgi:hypothetical protein